MIVYNNEAPKAVNNVGQFGATEGSIGAYKSAAEYAADAKYWALLSQTKYSSVEEILAEVERLYAQGRLLEEDIKQLKNDFESQEQVLLGLIQSTGTAIDNTNAATELSKEATQNVLAQLDIISNMTVQTTLLPPGSLATGSYDNTTGVFSFGIPEGKPGRDGTDGTISDISSVPVGIPVVDDYGFYVDKDDGGLYRADISDIANLIPSVRSVSINGGPEQTGSVVFDSVSSFNGRKGEVVPQSGDYSVNQVTGAAKSGANSDITSLSGLTTSITIEQGGTGATTASAARINLGLGSTSVEDIIPITKGGTGATTATNARTNLGLGLVATESIVPIAKGGTGSTSAENARLALVAAKRGDNYDITSLHNLTTPLSIEQGGTGATTPEGAVTALGLNGPSGSSKIGYKLNSSNSIATSVQSKLNNISMASDFGARPVAGFDNADAFARIIAEAEYGTTVQFSQGVYETSLPLRFTKPIKIIGALGTRIKLTTAGHPCVMEVDLRGPAGNYWGYGARVENFILDGNGYAVDGLSLRGVISSRFSNIRATNVTRAGLHCWWTQLNVYENFQCSNNVEAFKTKPTTGVLYNCEFGTGNDRGSSADTFINPEIEHVSHTGIAGYFVSNTVFINGTSEGNNIGIEFGHPTDARNQAVSNTIIGMDLEVNKATDILLHPTTYANTFTGIMSGFSSPSIQVQGSYANRWYGGTCSGIDFNATSHDNRVYGISLIGASSVITDSGINNRYNDVFNITSGASMETSNPYPNRSGVGAASGQTVTINPNKDSLTSITATGTPISISSTTKVLDGARMDLIIYNQTGKDSLVINWDSNFRVSGFTSPLAGRHKGLSLVYSSNYGFWSVVGQATTDSITYP